MSLIWLNNGLRKPLDWIARMTRWSDGEVEGCALESMERGPRMRRKQPATVLNTRFIFLPAPVLKFLSAVALARLRDRKLHLNAIECNDFYIRLCTLSLWSVKLVRGRSGGN